MDFALLEALSILDNETCKGCGAYIWLCDWPGNDVVMKVSQRVCQGQRSVRERQNKDIKDAKQKAEDLKSRHEWGLQRFSYAVLGEHSDRDALPTRKEYYELKKETNV